jgi:hypothetical protein
MNGDDFLSDEVEQDFGDSSERRLEALLEAFADHDSERGCCRIEVNGRVRRRNGLTQRQCERAADEVGGRMTWSPGQDC